MSVPTIDLADGWSHDANVVTVTGEHSTSVFRLPKGRSRVTLHRLGRGRGQLVIGGFKTVTVVVNGRYADVEKLMKEVL